MVRIIMHGCNGKMGQVIGGLLQEDKEARLVAGVDVFDDGHNSYPVYQDIWDCDVEADCVVDFSTAAAVDRMLDYCVEKNLPCVLCSTGLSQELLQKTEKAAESIALLRSANMSLGINLLLKLLKNAAGVLAPAGFDMEILEKHHNLKTDAPSGTALALADSINEEFGHAHTYVYDRSAHQDRRGQNRLSGKGNRHQRCQGRHYRGGP